MGFFLFCWVFIIPYQYKDNCVVAKDLFAGHCWTPVELQTQLVPYLAQISVPLDNPGRLPLPAVYVLVCNEQV